MTCERPASALGRFREPVSRWFTGAFGTPTPVQEQTWDAVSRGEHALVVAPTGSGKTLAAFLWALDGLTDPDRAPSDGVTVLYVSPLKALGVDVERNLAAPLAGIRAAADDLGARVAPVRVGVRTGDTPPAERARLVRRPPDILITTPESLHLMLTSSARRILAGVRTVIIDEVHAVAGSKRGSHLALSLERLDLLVGHDVQRIGLSATVRPIDEVAAFLGGDRPVRVVAPPAHKRWQVGVQVPVPDMADLPEPPVEASVDVADSALPTRASMWPFIEKAVLEQVEQPGSTLVFVNARRAAERLTSRLNELWAAEHDPEALAPPGRRTPAQFMAASDEVGAAPALIARAHHGSVSKEERAGIEEGLRSGELRCVVATSSLELGIDMGLVDRVVQVEAPPSVSSALQRIGRAGHQVGGVSRGTVLPKTRLDLLHCAVVTGRMLEGRIEALHMPVHPLDVLAQQTVAAAVSAPDGIDLETWLTAVRRSRPYADLSDDLARRVVDMLTGRYASGDLADLRARLVETDGVLTARPGALRLVTTSGGTIPDRGLFGVFLLGEGAGRRVGELDEEMVYESRVGDVFTLGASSWRIAEITRDQVRVLPAPGHTGRLPFWYGDDVGRPAELGRAMGEFTRAVHDDPTVLARLDFLDDFARDNITALLDAQAEATGVLPDDRHIVLERFHDEVGDWRVVVHSPWGRPVNAAWALAVSHRLAEDLDIEVQAVAGDDGMVLRMPEADTPPGAEILVVDPDEVVRVVSAQVGGTALFAARFRECAARALLLPRTDPRRRAPLWQQRLRAAQLLERVHDLPDFPILLETARECLTDVYDLEALAALMTDIASGRVRIAEVTTASPSPMASSLLFGYTGAFLYDGDRPLSDRRTAALSLDPSLLASIMGTLDLRELLDPDLIAQVVAELRSTGPGRRARDAEGLVDLLARLGPIRLDDVAAHLDDALTAGLDAARQALGGRVVEVGIGGVRHLAAATDLPLLRDGLGVALPAGTPDPGPSQGRDPLTQLVARWARCHGPFTAGELAAALGTGAATVRRVLTGDRAILSGHFTDGVDEVEFCDRHVLDRIRSLALARARDAVAPVSPSAFARFTLDWHQVAAAGERPVLRGVDGVLEVLEQLAGVGLPASAWESVVLPARVADYRPGMLDDLLASGEVTIVGRGQAGPRDPLLALLPADVESDLSVAGTPDLADDPTASTVLAALAGGSRLLGPLLEELAVSPTEGAELLWSLLAAGLVAPDGFGPVRALLASGTTAHRVRRPPVRSRARLSRRGLGRPRRPENLPGGVHRTSGPVEAVLAGRWHRVTPAAPASPAALAARCELLMDRHGVLTRGAVDAEGIDGGFATAYRVLSGFEEAGRVLRGYLVEGLGGAQFATTAVIDDLRHHADSPGPTGWPGGRRHPRVVVLAATDPANPYGAALPWPQLDGTNPSRAAGALVVLVDGLLVAHLSRGGRHLGLFTSMLPDGIDAADAVELIVPALRATLSRAGSPPLDVELVNGSTVRSSGLEPAFRAAGAELTPRGVRLTASTGPSALPSAP